MCGICGFFSKSPLKFDDIIVKMNSAILHRGPNSSGFWLDENTGIALGHQRLSIIDLSANGSQPMKSSSGRFILVYNGEIYNHMDLRKNLDKINYGHKWRGNSDTETLLEALDTWGIESTLKKLAGMFAFALWDKKNLCLTLARDRMGEKPLYFGWQGSGSTGSKFGGCFWLGFVQIWRHSGESIELRDWEMDWEPGAWFEAIWAIESDGNAAEAGLAVVFGWGLYIFGVKMVGESIKLRGWEMDWEPGKWFEAIWSMELQGKAAEADLVVVFGWGWYVPAAYQNLWPYTR
jgi:hypothetical protein